MASPRVSRVQSTRSREDIAKASKGPDDGFDALRSVGKPTQPTVSAAPKRVPAASGASLQEMNALRTELDETRSDNTELQTTIEALEKERDFYFSKLRDIELICQDLDKEDSTADAAVKKLSEQITEILYATEEGFQPPADENGAAEEDQY